MARESFGRSLVSNIRGPRLMARMNELRRVLPLTQTGVAILFGGWGLWIRNAILSRPFFPGVSGWESTARFHIWPWPFKFAAVLNLPAFLASALVSWPLDALWPVLSESVSILLALVFVYLLWSWIGSWLDRKRTEHKDTMKRQCIGLSVFVAICAAASSIPQSVGGYASYLPAGILVWLTAAVGIALWGMG
jgi:hypothetical protein